MEVTLEEGVILSVKVSGRHRVLSQRRGTSVSPSDLRNGEPGRTEHRTESTSTRMLVVFPGDGSLRGSRYRSLHLVLRLQDALTETGVSRCKTEPLLCLSSVKRIEI